MGNRVQQVLACAVGVGLLASFGGCSSSDPDQASDAPPSSPPSASARDLYTQDVKDLSHFNATGPTQFDQVAHGPYPQGTFAALFGGTDLASVQKYYQDRVKIVISPDEDASISPGEFDNERWFKNPTQSGDDDKSVGSASSSQVQIGALNFGTQWWLEGLVNNVDVTLYYNRQVIDIDSSRVGIVLLGPGYSSSFSVNGKSVTPPPAFRESILMHEARHSDCTGGLSQAQLQAMQNATSPDEYETAFPSRACGHLHVTCPASLGKALSGLAACDSEKWGAYTVGAIYAAAMIDNYSDQINQTILDSMAEDAASRFIGTDDGSAPDMSSAGLQPAPPTPTTPTPPAASNPTPPAPASPN